MHRPTYAEITSTLALFIALGGVSWAATTLPKNSVTSGAIRDGDVRSVDLSAGSVSASKLSKSLRAELGIQGGKGADGTSGANGTNGASGSDGKNGTAGPQGPAGATGAQGPAGRDGAGLVASQNFGTHVVTNTKFVKIGEMSWNQPANSIDDIRGVYTAMGASCSNGMGGTPYQLVVDGNEVSYDVGNFGVNSFSDSWNPEAEIRYPYGQQAKQDRGVFGSEIPLITGASPATHKLEMYLRNDFCSPSATIKDVTVYVTRFAG